LKKSLIIIGLCLLVFGFSWHFVKIFDTGSIFLLDDICNFIREPPPLGTPPPVWMIEGACNWLPIAVLGSYASTSGGIVLIIGGFIIRKKKEIN